MTNEDTILLIAMIIFVGLPFVVVALGFFFTLRQPRPDDETPFGDASHYDKSLHNARRSNWRASQ